MSQGWIGVDLDATLAHYDEWRGETHIGAPIPRMIARVKAWIASGQEVRIFTARVWRAPGRDVDHVVAAIQEWCIENIGCALAVTCEKDYRMIELWDDRAVQVVPNTGERADMAEAG